MKKLLACVCAFLLGLALLSSQPKQAEAMSLWSEAAPAASMFADRKARAVGDTITIIVSENSSATRTGKADNSKSASTSMDAGVGIFKWIGSASAGKEDDFKAEGKLSNTNNVNARLTVTVVEVKPNGNLVLSGTQSIKQNGEEQKITITGTVRSDDVTAENTVLSTYVADAQIKIEGNGPIAQKQRQGIITRILDFLF